MEPIVDNDPGDETTHVVGIDVAQPEQAITCVRFANALLIDAALDGIRDEMKRNPSRELSLAATNIEQGRLWYLTSPVKENE